MALKVNASGDARDFDRIWTHIRNLVSVEWQSVLRECGDPPPGLYDIRVELNWDIEPVDEVKKQPCGHPVSCITRNPDGTQWCTACVEGQEHTLMRCGTCGGNLQLVRPGKWQCPDCE
jgi:hypothetical protein